MKALFLLLVLTQNSAGDINASFVNTKTREQCQQKEKMLRDVFLASNISVIDSRCVQSDLKFSEFDHATSSSQIRNFYLITIGNDLQIKNVSDWSVCRARSKQLVENAQLYCSSSVQSLEEN